MTPASPQRVFLAGYRGTGKTTVARLLAARLGWETLDADEEVVHRAGKPIATIFADQGEQAFRDLEEQVVADLCSREKAIVALGGGAVLRKPTRDRLREAGPVVWLTADAQTLAERIAGDASTKANRPRLTDLDAVDEVRKLLTEREPLYRECATLSLDTGGKSPEEIADSIAHWLRTD